MNLKQLRLKAGLTQAQASAHVGASIRAWQAWESDSPSARPVPPHVLEKMHALTGTPQPGRVTAVWLSHKGVPVTVQSGSIRGLVSLLQPLEAPRSSAELVAAANDLAREFYALRGYVVAKRYKFYEATHPQEVEAWHAARLAFERLLATDVQDAITDMEDDL